MRPARIGPYVAALAATFAFSLSACSSGDEGDVPAPSPNAAPATTVDHADPVASAMAAAPKAVGAKATIVMAAADGSMKVLREGSNGWTCMPDTPATPGPDPMCMDANAATWGMAWMSHGAPPAETPGFIYMLAGGTDASNTDPYATKPDGDWIRTGPHVMIVGSMKALAGYPSGPRPDTSAPYVMWAGTPYAHLMIPVE